MNLTFFSLATTLISHSPMIQLTSSYGSQNSFDFNYVFLHHFHKSFLSSYINNQYVSICNSLFDHFLNSPINVQSVTNLVKQTITTHQTFTDTEYVIDACNFLNCNGIGDNNYKYGGAILFVHENAKLTVHGTTFDNCYTSGDGGAIFAVGIKGETNKQNKDYTHQNMQNFNSHYCCYSHCSAECADYSGDQYKYSGYGSALLVAASNIELNFSATSECPSTGKSSYGAQFDINTNNVKSCFINATTGDSYCCGSIEYRQARTGFFRYQTIVNQICAFGTSFTSIQGPIEISNCNMVGNTLRYIAEAPSLCLVHVRFNSVTIKNFIVMETKIGNTGNKPIGFATKGEGSSNQFDITVVDCTFDTTIGKNEYFAQITTQGVIKVNNDDPTHHLSLLYLGNCKGEVEPPPLAETNKFTASSDFTFSEAFSKSDEFSKSDKFERTEMFTESGDFTQSRNFDLTDPFSPSNTFTPSSDFSCSQKFTRSVYFSSSNTVEPVVDKGVDLGQNKKDNKPAIIGGVVGAVAAAAIIAAVIFFIIKKKHQKFDTNSADIIKETGSSVTVDNNLNTVMENDDPFAADFNNELADIK